MSPREMQIEVERRLQLISPTLAIDNKLPSDTILSFINEAVDKFWKTRYSGINFKQRGFEQDQKLMIYVLWLQSTLIKIMTLLRSIKKPIQLPYLTIM